MQNTALTLTLHDEAVQIMVALIEEGSDPAMAIVDRLQTTVIPTILMQEDLDLADTMLDEVVCDVISMANEVMSD